MQTLWTESPTPPTTPSRSCADRTRTVSVSRESFLDRFVNLLMVGLPFLVLVMGQGLEVIGVARHAVAPRRADTQRRGVGLAGVFAGTGDAREVLSDEHAQRFGFEREPLARLDRLAHGGSPRVSACRRRLACSRGSGSVRCGV